MATQEKTWNVANRLHSLKDSDNPEVNHIITGADEIYDDTKGAKQSDINAQTDAALADRYTKAETYSKEQLDSLITTPDVNYVTVATFADLPQTGEANTIYRVSSYDGIQVDASKYALYAWNGTAYQLLAVRSAVGEVFDVSEYNSGATYETISAALAAVPASVQRGGMSIKFILRTNTGTEEEPVYHDEYVQYRLMSTDWSTVITDWQGVDKVPTPGSHNFVESGGVQNELALGAIYDVSAKNPTAGSNNDGKFESLSALLSDANLNTLIPTAYRKGGMSIKFVQSSDNKYVQCFLTKDEWSVNKADWQKMNLEEEVIQLKKEIGTGVELPITEEGKYIQINQGVGETAGPITESSSFHYIKYPITEGDTIIVTGRGATSPRLWAITDNNDVILALSPSRPSSAVTYTLIAPANSAYIIINYPISETKSAIYYKHDSIIKQIDSIDTRLDSWINSTDTRFDSEEEKIKEIEQTLGIGIALSITEEGKYIQINQGVGEVAGPIATSNLLKYIKAPIVPGSTIVVTGRAGTNPLLWAVTDSNDVILALADYHAEVTTDTIIAPANSAYIIINYRIEEPVSAIYYTPKNVFSQLDDIKVELTTQDKATEKNYLLYDANKDNTSVQLNGWTLSDGVFTNTGTGWSNMLLIDREYFDINRKVIVDFNLVANGIIYFGFLSNVNARRLQQSLFSVNFSINTLNLHLAPSDNTITNVYESKSFQPSSYGNKYRVEMTCAERGAVSIKLYDITQYQLLSSITKEFQFAIPDWGLMFEKPFVFAANVGFNVYSFKVLSKHSQNILLQIIGDSITQGYYATDSEKCYAGLLSNELGIARVVQSGRSGGNIDNVLDIVASETSVLKPEYVMVTIGTNGGNTLEKLTTLINNIVAIGSKPIINHIPMRSNGAQGSINEMIDEAILQSSNDVRCVKMDVATALNYDISDGYDSAISYDGIHPNDLGHNRMYLQAKIDVPELFD